MSAEKYRQFTLKRDSFSGTAWLVTWLPEKRGSTEIVEGTRLTLEGKPSQVWTVETRHTLALTREELSALRTNARNFGPSLDESERITA